MVWLPTKSSRSRKECSIKGYVGAQTAGVYRSTDNGDSWTPTRNGMGGTGVYALSRNRGAIFAAGRWSFYLFYNYNSGIYGDGWPLGPIFRSSEEGNTWIPLDTSHGLPLANGWTVKAFGNWVFARTGGCGNGGCSSDPYVSSDGGDTWHFADS